MWCADIDIYFGDSIGLNLVINSNAYYAPNVQGKVVFPSVLAKVFKQTNTGMKSSWL